MLELTVQSKNKIDSFLCKQPEEVLDSEIVDVVGVIDIAETFLKDLKKKIWEHGSKSMSARGVKKIVYGSDGTEIICSHEKKTKINIEKMVEHLRAGNKMAYLALAGGQSAWKAAQVKIMQDTIGVTDLYEETFEDELKLKKFNPKFAK